jgi:hypothetical protein
MDTENKLNDEFISYYDEIDNLKILLYDMRKNIAIISKTLLEKNEAFQKIASKLHPNYQKYQKYKKYKK